MLERLLFRKGSIRDFYLKKDLWYGFQDIGIPFWDSSHYKENGIALFTNESEEKVLTFLSLDYFIGKDSLTSLLGFYSDLRETWNGDFIFGVKEIQTEVNDIGKQIKAISEYADELKIQREKNGKDFVPKVKIKYDSSGEINDVEVKRTLKHYINRLCLALLRLDEGIQIPFMNYSSENNIPVLDVFKVINRLKKIKVPPFLEPLPPMIEAGTQFPEYKHYHPKQF